MARLFPWLVIGVYLVGVTVVARLSGQPWAAVALIDADRVDPIWIRLGVVFPSVAAATLLAYVLPMLPVAWRRWGADGWLPTLTTAVVGSVITLTVATTVLKLGGVIIGRHVVLGCAALITLVTWSWMPPPLAVLARRMPWRGLAAVAVTTSAVTLWLWGEIAIEAFSGDGLEAFALATSLSTELYPTWDIELEPSGPWDWHMAHPPLLPFVHQPIIELVGRAEGTLRMLYVIVIAAGVGVMPALVRVGRTGGTPTGAVAVAIGGWVLLSVGQLYYSGLAPFAELAKSAGLVLLLCALTACVLAVRGLHLPALAAAVAAAGIRWYAPVYVVIGAAALSLMRVLPWRATAALVSTLGAWAAMGSALVYFTERWDLLRWQVGYEHLPLLTNQPAWMTAAPAVLLHVLVFSGGLLPLCLWWPRLDAVGRALSLTALTFLVFVLQSTLVAVHFILPVSILAAVAAARLVASVPPARQRLASGGALLLVLVSLVIVWPTNRTVIDYPRRVGRLTCLHADTNHQAVELARAAAPAISDRIGVRVGAHVLAYYAATAPEPRTCVVNAGFDERGLAQVSIRENELSTAPVEVLPYRFKWLRRVLTSPE